jgi:hypothetical protein
MSDAAVIEIWTKYRGWAQRASAIKAGLDRWRLWTLVMTIAGAFLATLAGSLKGDGASNSLLPQALSAASAVAMAVAAFLSRSMLDPQVEREWIRARSLAEACKSEAFRFATTLPPYDGNDAEENWSRSSRSC